MRRGFTITTLCFGLFLSSWGLARPDPGPEEPVSPETNAQYAKRMRVKARDLALEELARMSAADLVYRNQSELHTRESLMMNTRTGVYVKLYRDFKAYSIIDIYRSDSIMAPISFEIRYTYDIIGTTPRQMEDTDSEALSQRDSVYEDLGTYQLTRWYECDEDGNYLGNLPVLPSRPDFYTLGRQPSEGTRALRNPRPKGKPVARPVSRGPR